MSGAAPEGGFARPLAPGRPTFAVVASSPSPYRISQHLRYARELAEVNLVSVFIDHQNWQPWSSDLPEEIRPVVISRGTGQGKGVSLAEWKKGGRVIGVLREVDARAALITGYNSACKVRVIRWLRSRGIPRLLFGDSNIVADRIAGVKGKLKKAYVSWIVSQMSGLTPCGRHGRAFFERYGGDARRMVYVPHGPNFDELGAIPDAEVRDMASKHGLAQGRQRIIYCARMVDVKRPDLLIDAFAAIAGERPGWDLVMVGGGDLEQPMRERVPAELRGRVIFTGFVNEAREIYCLYRASSVFCLPSRFEPWAAVVPEAVGCGCAVVASDAVGAAGDLVFDDRNGYRFPSEDLGALTEKLRQATEPDRLDRLRAGTLEVLAEYRRTHDSVANVRRALIDAGVIDRREGVPVGPTAAEVGA